MVRILYDEKLLETLKRVYGCDLEKFLEAITRPTPRLYARVNILKTSPNQVIESIRSRGIDVFKDEGIPEAIYFPVEGPEKLNELDLKIYVDKRAAESIILGANLYTPGIIKCDRRVRKGSEVCIVAPNGDVIAIGIARMSCEEAITKQRGLFVEVTKSLYKAPHIIELQEYKEGLIYPQSLPAIITSKILDPKPGEVIIDMCAAPGGKTGHIVELTRGRAFIIAFDHSKTKLERMKMEMRRLGHDSLVEIWRADSRYLSMDFPWLVGKVDKILIDPPCTALGVRPKVIDEKKYEDVLNASNYQFQFLKEAVKIIKSRGVIVYSTCTVTIEENEEIIERAVKELDLEPEKIDIGIGTRGILGNYRDFYIRFHPHIHGTPGYFIAKLRKR